MNQKNWRFSLIITNKLGNYLPKDFREFSEENFIKNWYQLLI